MTTAAELLSLQEIDIALDRALQRRGEIEESLGETEELGEARCVRDEKDRAFVALRESQRELEWQVDEVRRKAAEVESKLYGGTVRNPKELTDLQADLNSLKALLRKREDALLTLLVEAEEAEADLERAKDELAKIEADWRAGQGELQAELERLQPEIARLQAARDQEAVGVDRASLGLYQMLRERRDGHAVARVERGMCGGCRISLPMSVLQRARSGGGLVQCVSCERILLVS